MKITESMLRKIIREELSKSLSENPETPVKMGTLGTKFTSAMDKSAPIQAVLQKLDQIKDLDKKKNLVKDTMAGLLGPLADVDASVMMAAFRDYLQSVKKSAPPADKK